ncbi:MAG: glycosidase, partial [Candidatus Cloacimonetes bacterium]|nr:glycosidase [Candidatus Cloacimonadota bacterium]
MIKIINVLQAQQKLRFLTAFLFFCFAAASYANTPNLVTTYQDEYGWKLQVDGEDFFVKGIVWGYTPIGENYAYNLWANPDPHIQKVLDYECDLMKNAGINTIRSFGLIPPEWVSYIYQKHGIMTVVNHLMGRYGYNVGGAWVAQTNYADPLTRETLKKDIIEMVKQYKDTPGVLMFALGNESNYGLEWSSFEIENLPVGEQHKEKAKSLYSLFNEIIQEGKQVDPNHPFTIVNGDIQYLDLIVEYCQDLDILGVNSYRGISFTDMWKRVDAELDLPVMLTEFGSDAFNALEYREDQAGQAEIIKGNWQEIYNKSYANGEEGNAIGGCLFEWRDEWWKYKQVENLFIQDTNASWSNGGYSFDYVEGRNNMNEEWFGICGLGGPNDDGVYVAEPRMAYDVLSEIWSIDPYAVDKTEMNYQINKIDMQVLDLAGNVRLLQSAKKKNDAIRLSGGSLRGDMVFNGKSEEVENKGKNGLDFSNGEMLFLNFDFHPISKIKGNFTLNILGNVVDKQLEEYYGKRGETYVTVVSEQNENGLEVNTSKDVTDFERLEIYNFEAVYSTDHFDLTSFYHVPRFHWGYKGDTYGLMYEATDMDGMDIWNAKAPYGIEF